MKKTGIITLAVGIIALIICAILRIKRKAAFAISIIGGADGPTSVFIAGKPNTTAITAGIIIAILLVLTGIILIIKNKK